MMSESWSAKRTGISLELKSAKTTDLFSGKYLIIRLLGAASVILKQIPQADAYAHDGTDGTAVSVEIIAGERIVVCRRDVDGNMAYGY